ncbi:MAG: hypothetical protein ACK5V3_08920 [Bdellovibrionales bacterium]
MLDRRPDYCDLQIKLSRKATVEILETDDDGVEFKTFLSTYDGWAVEFFQFMGIEYDLKGFYKKFYQAKDGSLVWARESDNDDKVSLQFKGSHFLRTDWQSQFTKAISFFKSRNIKFHPSRWDVGILFLTKNEQDLYRLIVDKEKWPQMRCHYQFETKFDAGFIAKHSRLEVAFYNKHRQVEEVKSGTTYKELLLEVLKMTALPTNLIKCDIRIRQKDQTRIITQLLMADEINFEAIEGVVLQKCLNKTKMGRTLRKYLGLSKIIRKRIPFIKTRRNKS